MTERYHSLTVALEHDMREDDAQGIIDAILHIKGVIGVTGNAVDVTDFIAVTRVRTHYWNEIRKIFFPEERP